jgi:hypothetical protein
MSKKDELTNLLKKDLEKLVSKQKVTSRFIAEYDHNQALIHLIELQLLNYNT